MTAIDTLRKAAKSRAFTKAKAEPDIARCIEAYRSGYRDTGMTDTQRFLAQRTNGVPVPSPLAPASATSLNDSGSNSAADPPGPPDAEADASTCHPTGPDTKNENQKNPEPKVGEQAHVGGFIIECGAPQRPGLPLSYTIHDREGRLITAAVAGWSGAIKWIKARADDGADMRVRIVKPSQPLGPSRAEQWATVARHRPEAHRRRS